jgi:hypothetical protein
VRGAPAPAGAQPHDHLAKGDRQSAGCDQFVVAGLRHVVVVEVESAAWNADTGGESVQFVKI